MPAPKVRSVGRIPIVDVGPVLEAGRWPARAVVGEAVPITATIFREGHDAEGATVVVTRPSGRTQTLPMPLKEFGISLYEAIYLPSAEGLHTLSRRGVVGPVRLVGTRGARQDSRGRRRAADARRGRRRTHAARSTRCADQSQSSKCFATRSPRCATVTKTLSRASPQHCPTPCAAFLPRRLCATT